MEAVMTAAEFSTIKTICSAIGLVLFGGIFVAVAIWAYRPNAKKYYQDQARKILED